MHRALMVFPEQRLALFGESDCPTFGHTKDQYDQYIRDLDALDSSLQSATPINRVKKSSRVTAESSKGPPASTAFSNTKSSSSSEISSAPPKVFGGSHYDDTTYYTAVMGRVTDITPQLEIPGWKRFTMVEKYFQENEPGLVLAHYEGCMLPGNQMILGRWWSGPPSNPSECGPFIYWNTRSGGVFDQLADSAFSVESLGTPVSASLPMFLINLISQL
jgi:hypothetical protein